MKRHAHPVAPVPTNVRYGRTYHAAPPRIDPGYDQPGPIRRGDLSWALVAQGVVVALGVFLFIVLASIVAVNP